MEQARNPSARPCWQLGRSFGEHVACLRASQPRTRRIVLLLVAIFAMSAFDLLFTLTYLQGVGMVEVNPVARKVMEFGSPTLLSVWKLGIVGGACLVVYLGRQARVAEAGAWFACLALMALTLHWLRYIDSASDITPYLEVVKEVSGGQWLAMTPE